LLGEPILSCHLVADFRWELIADGVSKAGWSWGYVSALDHEGRTIWVADAHRGDGKWLAMCHIAGLTNDHIRLEAVNRPKGCHHAAEKQRDY